MNGKDAQAFIFALGRLNDPEKLMSIMHELNLLHQKMDEQHRRAFKLRGGDILYEPRDRLMTDADMQRLGCLKAVTKAIHLYVNVKVSDGLSGLDPRMTLIE